MAKGDKIDVSVRAGSEIVAFGILARQNGRTVDYTFEKDGGVQWVVVRELTRGGTTAHEARFLASEVMAIVRTQEV